jgi:hypothetical protein
MANEASKSRYHNIARLFATLSFNKAPTYADTVDKILGQLSNEELFDLFYGSTEEISTIMKKYNLPYNFMDLLGMLIDGEPTTAKILTLSTMNVPPKDKMH